MTSKEALEKFAKRLHDDFEKWYEDWERIFRWWYLSLQLLAFVVSILTAVFAALSNKENFDNWVKYVLVILPIIGSVAIAVLSQLRLYDMWKLREQGRIQFQDLAIEADRLAAASNESESNAVYENLQKRMTEIESTQSASFFGLFTSNLVLELQKKP
jgi:type II secretory pathway component PulF